MEVLVCIFLHSLVKYSDVMKASEISYPVDHDLPVSYDPLDAVTEVRLCNC
jgi:hypothetical protein